ncbi:hypothetical protein SAMN02745166_00775 [Prosthecobacter debontii]|uniref:Uncharacterized protein n=2 Tax=Prosthecobacter debontii TaxID=48467 RepID=A0A1T4WW64_9BACT|nr:hypothetical protein SAMN02745166_00775 [Prosthecobacter debontii]
MGFSFRSMFQPSLDPQGQAGTSAPDASGWAGGGMGMDASTAQAPPLNAQSAFATAGPLFRTLSGESLQAAPVQASPFAVQSGGIANAPLTVSDVLPQLPPELARVNGLAPDQPVAISAQVLDAALRSGQAALPIFEIYRVCPALFLSPVSPQDPRLVPLPASKLPRLIASAQQPMNGEAAPAAPSPASPFGLAQTTPASPFGMAAPTQPPAGEMPQGGVGTSLPPRRNGPPPPLADVPRDAAPSLSLPGNAAAPALGQGMPVFPTSPFTVSAESAHHGTAGGASQASPFAVMKPAEPPRGPEPLALPASPFSVPAAQAFAPASPSASPFSVPSPGAVAGLPASPFASQGGAPAPVEGPSASGPAPSPLTSLFGAKAVPTGQPAPDAPAKAAGTFFSSSLAGAGTGGGPTVRVGLAVLLRGYSVAELGFDPVMVPSWIMTSIPVPTVKQWAESPSPLAELGLLIDGINDVGFRNVLNHAKRDFQVRIPPEQVNAALAGNAPPTLPNLASLGHSPASAPAAPVMRVEPPAQPQAFAAPPSSPVEAPAPQASLFATAGQSEAPPLPPNLPASAPGAPLFSTPSPPPTFAPAASAMAPTFQPSGMPGFPTGAAPITNPFAQSIPSSSPTVEPVAEPVTEAFPPSAVEPPPATPQFTPPFTAASPFRAPLKTEAPSEGFSSAELMGGFTQESVAQVPPAPAIPVTNPFTGKAATTVVDVPEDDEPPPLRKQPFIPPTSESSKEVAPQKRRTVISPPGTSRSSARPASPALGIQSHESNPDQILLRALLGSDEDLTPQRVVEMVCSLPGIAACVCLHGDHAISHAGAHKPQAREFQKQAIDLAHHLRSLAPLIGIEGAETFTLTSGDRLMTFCFPEGAILGVLHDADPSLGLRDKITLIARELSRMLD